MRNGVAIFIVVIIIALIVIILNPNFASNEETKLSEEIKTNEKNVKFASVNFIETYYLIHNWQDIFCSWGMYKNLITLIHSKFHLYFTWLNSILQTE